jgi:hypothetical protein
MIALIPHGCCLFAFSTGYWGAATASPCHGTPILQPTVEIAGLALAALALFDSWRGGNGHPLRGLLLLIVAGLLAWTLQWTVLEQVALSALSKAGQGYFLLLVTWKLLQAARLVSPSVACPACLAASQAQ